MNRAAAPKQSGMNQQKFEELFSKYRSMVYRTAKSITGRRQDALDIQQTVFLRLSSRQRPWSPRQILQVISIRRP